MPHISCWWLAVLILWLLVQSAHARDMNLVVTLGRADLQRRIERMFPMVREDGWIELRLHDPQVVLTEHSNRIGLRLRLDASAARQFAVTGQAMVDGVLRFAGDTGQFFLDDARIEELHMAGVPELYLKQIQQLADGVVREVLHNQPIYTLGQMGESKRILGSKINKLSVRDGKLIVELEMP